MMVWIKAAASAAAVLVLEVCFCLANPVLAAKLPIIGKIFEQIESDVTYSGEFKDKADILTTEQENTSELANAAYNFPEKHSHIYTLKNPRSKNQGFFSTLM